MTSLALPILLVAVYVPPHDKDALIVDFLGAGDAVAGCHLAHHATTATGLVADYQCSVGIVHVRLEHPLAYPHAQRYTPEFALDAEPAAPELLAALVERIESRGARWRWMKSEDGVVTREGARYSSAALRSRWETDAAIAWERRAALFIAALFPVSLLVLAWLVAAAARRL